MTGRGATPLFVACLFGQVGVVEVLVKKGEADVYKKNKEGKKAGDVVCHMTPSLNEDDRKKVAAEIKAILMVRPP